MENTEKKLPYKVFISYSHADSEKAKLIADKCELFGLQTWLDKKIEPGANWSEAILKAVKSCDIAIVIISKDAISSNWTNKEWSFLCEEKWNRPNIQIVPINLDDTKPPSFIYNNISYGDIDEDLMRQFIKKLISNLRPPNCPFHRSEKTIKNIEHEVVRRNNRVKELKEIIKDKWQSVNKDADDE